MSLLQEVAIREETKMDEREITMMKKKKRLCIFFLFGSVIFEFLFRYFRFFSVVEMSKLRFAIRFGLVGTVLIFVQIYNFCENISIISIINVQVCFDFEFGLVMHKKEVAIRVLDRFNSV